MSFSYDPNNPSPSDVDIVRLLIPDTVNTLAQPCIFQDQEIQTFFRIQQSQFQSSMFFSGSAGRNLPNSPVSYLRVAALAIDTIASNSARIGLIQQLLDVKLAPEKAAAALRAQAQAYRDTDDNAGAFFIIEQVSTGWAFVQRFWNQVQRQQGGGTF